MSQATIRKPSERAETLWPFPVSQLTAGLRRRLQRPSLKVVEMWQEPMPGRSGIGTLRGLGVEVQYGSREEQQRQRLSFVVKEPVGTTRAGLAGVGLREVGIYRALSGQLPLATPGLVAADQMGGWLVMERLPAGRPTEAWTADDYRVATAALARLHDRFWGLGEDLSNYPWLARPFTGDFPIHLQAAKTATDSIVQQSAPSILVAQPGRLKALRHMLEHAEAVVEPLRAAPQTLLHGDYWPGNLSILPDGRLAAFDWQLSGLGPGVIDLLVLLNNGRWWGGELPLPPEELVASYRQAIAEGPGFEWTDAEWQLLWDHAVMWRFMQEWLDLLAAMPAALVEARAPLLDEIWVRPVMEAIQRRL
jgi:Phosphotransferase enzyme family